MRIIVTGCGGFIGSNLVDKLLLNNHQVIGIDNFSTGKKANLKTALENKNFDLIDADLLNINLYKDKFKNIDLIYHLAANADIRYGMRDPYLDINQNIITTLNILDLMTKSGVNKIIFASSSAVYGQSKIIPTPDDVKFPIQTSLYGSSKVCAEGLITSYCEAYEIKCWIYRFAGILGPRYSHGHIYDFYKQLIEHSDNLTVQGDGNQKKSYVHVNDCLNAIEMSFHKSSEKINIFNIGLNDTCDLNESINWITNYMNLKPKINFTGGEKGWHGDNPFVLLDISKLVNLGWEPTINIKQSVEDTLKYLINNEKK